ncbi:MAG: 2-dehydro-3-deoxy-phosphogluconate aldolase [Wenzhouxiangellaceae bacterium]
MSIAAHNDRLRALLECHTRIPVVTIQALTDIAPLVERLAQREIRIIEVTLRTSCAIAAIAELKQQYPEVALAAGTVLDAEQFAAAADAGADFIVSPGYHPALSEQAGRFDLPLLPGVMTPSEIIAARVAGHRLMKLFPASIAGGVGMLKSLAGPFPDIQFCPTGGIGREQMAAYLALSNVIAVGASWLAD